MRVALCQMNSQSDKEENTKTALALLDQAAAQGAQVAMLPECLDYQGPEDGIMLNAEEADGPLASALAAKAKEHGLWVIGGTIRVRDSSERVTNTMLVFDPNGELAASYVKLHMFDIDIPGQISFMESRTVRPGDKIVTTEIAGVVSGLSICYDLRFPELFRLQALAGAKVLFLPAAFTKFTGEAHWELLLRARAVENQCFVVAVGQYGEYMPGKATFGHSLVVDPWGKVLACSPEGTGVTTIDLDFAYLDKVRNDVPALRNRRPDIYSLSAAG